jgi:hypothetical protein
VVVELYTDVVVVTVEVSVEVVGMICTVVSTKLGISVVRVESYVVVVVT